MRTIRIALQATLVTLLLTGIAYPLAMGKADAEAAAIYADAYGRAPELYRFLRTLTTYKDSIDKNSWLLLSTDAEVFQYLHATGGAAAAVKRKK